MSQSIPRLAVALVLLSIMWVLAALIWCAMWVIDIVSAWVLCSTKALMRWSNSVQRKCREIADWSEW